VSDRGPDAVQPEREQRSDQTQQNYWMQELHQVPAVEKVAPRIKARIGSRLRSR
jgi:hypothetical protein